MTLFKNKTSVFFTSISLIVVLLASVMAYRSFFVQTTPDDQPSIQQEQEIEISNDNKSAEGVEQLQKSQTSAEAVAITYTFTSETDGITALELLTEQAEVETQDFGSAGAFVTSINGTPSNAQYYWSFFVNGEYAQQGASQTILQEGDTITFTYEEITAN